MGIGTKKINRASPPEQCPMNDAGSAIDFVGRYQNEIRYVPEWKQWLLWNKTRWEKDNVTSSGINRLAEEYRRALITEAGSVKDRSKSDELVKRGSYMGMAHKRSAMLSIALHDERIQVSQGRIDSDPYLLGVTNGIVDLRTGKLLKPDRNLYVLKEMAAKFNTKAKCPRWSKFLDEIFKGDTSITEFVGKMLGYSLSGLTEEHFFTFLYGSGSNGKSTFLETIRRIFGDYSTVMGDDVMAKRQNGKSPDDQIAELHGIRLAVASETAEGDRLNESVIKKLTGGESVRGRRLYAHGFDFTPQCTIWICGNHKPDINGTDEGIWRRVRLIPFTRSFQKNQIDRQLQSKLLKEKDGILMWMIRYFALWKKKGLNPIPKEVQDAINEYRDDSDVFAEFISEKLIISPEGEVHRNSLYEAYSNWTRANGHKAMSNKTFTTRLRGRAIATEKKTGGQRRWSGISLVEEQCNFPDDGRTMQDVAFAAFTKQGHMGQ
jgi:putative DNA primase/helicase